jgi:hypothetical protein
MKMNAEEFREYERQKREWYKQAHAGEELSFEGCKLRVDPDYFSIGPGDLYFTPGRNTGAQLLTCREHNKKTGVVFPTTNDYPYDSNECFKVLSIDGEPFCS